MLDVQAAHRFECNPEHAASNCEQRSHSACQARDVLPWYWLRIGDYEVTAGRRKHCGDSAVAPAG